MHIWHHLWRPWGGRAMNSKFRFRLPKRWFTPWIVIIDTHDKEQKVTWVYWGNLKILKTYKHMTVWLMVVWWYCVLPELKIGVLCNVVFFSLYFNQFLSPSACLVCVLEIALLRIFPPFFVSDTHLSLYYRFYIRLYIL